MNHPLSLGVAVLRLPSLPASGFRVGRVFAVGSSMDTHQLWPAYYRRECVIHNVESIDDITMDFSVDVVCPKASDLQALSRK